MRKINKKTYFGIETKTKKKTKGFFFYYCHGPDIFSGIIIIIIIDLCSKEQCKASALKAKRHRMKVSRFHIDMNDRWKEYV